jgi:hypothetical protein
MLRYLVATLATTAAAFRTGPQLVPRPEGAFRLRGGSATLSLANVGAGLLGAAGTMTWVAPAAKLKQYGVEAEDVTTRVNMRNVGCWQLCAASVMLAGSRGPVQAASTGMFSAAIATLANVPNWELLDRDVGQQVSGAALFGVLGGLIMAGKCSPIAAAAVYLLTGGLIHFTPKSTAELYGVTMPVSDVGQSLLSVAGGIIFSSGAYLLSLTSGWSLPQAVATAFLVKATLYLMLSLLDAKRLGMSKAAPLFLAVVSAVLATLGAQ